MDADGDGEGESDGESEGGLKSFFSSRGFYTSVIAIGAIYIIYLIYQYVKKSQADVGGSTEYTYMYESNEYDFDPYQSEHTATARGFEYNVSINGS